MSTVTFQEVCTCSGTRFKKLQSNRKRRKRERRERRLARKNGKSAAADPSNGNGAVQ